MDNGSRNATTHDYELLDNMSAPGAEARNRAQRLSTDEPERSPAMHESHLKAEQSALQEHGDDVTKVPRRRSSNRVSGVFTGWYKEILWLILSVVSLIALAIFLDHYDGQPLPRLPSEITLNTILAIMSTICRASFVEPAMQSIAQLKWIWYKRRPRPLRDFEIFDKASRGPGGSLQLVFSTKAWYVTTLFPTERQKRADRSCCQPGSSAFCQHYSSCPRLPPAQSRSPRSHTWRDL
jgi:hypothetical protein